MVVRPVVLALATAIAVLTAASTARADVIEFFTDRASFDAAAGTALNRESFEDSFTAASTVAFGDFTLSEEGDSTNLVGQLNQTFADLLDVGSAITEGSFAAFYAGLIDNASGVFDFSIKSPISAFGVDITVGPNLDPDFDPGKFTDEIIVISFDIFLGDENLGGFSQFSSVNGPIFLGAIASDGLFDRVTVGAGPRVVAFDDAAFGTAADPVAVPEPTVLATLSLGLLAAAGAMAIQRRRRVHC
ncbi:MAG: hypothetical protein EA405_06880 [Rhodospirillales bacterium]|nr:MAG: hypothetical protein EA405_06880 [Rhodospirillales bacterium]